MLVKSINIIFLTPIRLLWRIGEGGRSGAYYPALRAISKLKLYKNECPIQHMQRMDPDHGTTKTIRPAARKRLECS